MRRVEGKMPAKATLLTWIAKQNDPFNRSGSPGPNLTLLFDSNSPYVGTFDEVLIFYRHAPQGDHEEQHKVAELQREIATRDSKIRVTPIPWHGLDPTDHAEIHAFLHNAIPDIRASRVDKPFVAHISPGTPSMQTIWVLMVETGEIESPVELVKTYRREDRNAGEPLVAKVSVGLDTFFKVYQRNQWLRRPDVEVIGWDPRRFRSDRLKAVYAEARRFAQVKVPLLILGERGTGKTTLASWIRSLGNFRKPENDAHPPVVPCGQYVEETMRAELFGYVKGAFTGANENKTGLLAVADGDTLFLDEIGDISAGLQRLLIKAVEEHIYSPLGSTKVQHSNFRLITATNRSSEELRERLDADFLDRIGLLRIEMPPLRELREDISWLWESVMAKAQLRAGVALPDQELRQLATGVLGQIAHHALPGNLRDLFVIAYRAVAALGDVHAPLAVADAIPYALAGLQATREPTIQRSEAQRVAYAFATRATLSVLLDQGPLATQEIIREFQRYMAQEIRRNAKETDRHVDQLSDIKERTLRNWAGN